jgi:hypothetical protein
MPETDTLTLVRLAYFASPRYEKRHINERKVDTDEGKAVAWDNVWDKRDDFDEWLRENSLGGFGNLNIIDHSLRHYLVMGENGALCQIVSKIFPEEDAKPVGFDSWKGPYRRIVLAKYMPAVKGIPEELCSALTERGYTEIQPDDKKARKAAESFWR